MAKIRTTTLERLRVIEGSLEARGRRVFKRVPAIAQAAIAAGMAFWVAREIFEHHDPFFAPVAVVIILGLAGGARINRAIEMSVGCIIGVGLGDLLVNLVGPGWWQISVVVVISLLVASFLTPSQLVANQVAIGSILIATIMPPGTEGGGFDRMIDAMVGSVIGLATIALLPTSPIHSGRHGVARVLGIVSSVLDDVAIAMEKRDVEALDEAVNAVQNTQAEINEMLDAAQGGREVSTLSPLLWAARRRVRTLERIVPAVERAMRNTRVLARRAQVLCRDGDEVSMRMINIVDELADVAASLSDLYDGQTNVAEAQEIPGLVRRLQVVASMADMSVINNDKVLSEFVLLAQARSITVDLLQICGWSEESAFSTLAPTSSTPAYPYERWPGIIEED